MTNFDIFICDPDKKSRKLILWFGTTSGSVVNSKGERCQTGKNKLAQTNVEKTLSGGEGE